MPIYGSGNSLKQIQSQVLLSPSSVPFILPPGRTHANRGGGCDHGLRVLPAISNRTLEMLGNFFISPTIHPWLFKHKNNNFSDLANTMHSHVYFVAL